MNSERGTVICLIKWVRKCWLSKNLVFIKYNESLKPRIAYFAPWNNTALLRTILWGHEGKMRKSKQLKSRPEAWGSSRVVTGTSSRVCCLRKVKSPFELQVENSRKIHPQGMRTCWPKDREEKRVGEHPSAWEREGEKPPALWLCFLCFSLPQACPM